jgi:hypothetical protein
MLLLLLCVWIILSNTCLIAEDNRTLHCAHGDTSRYTNRYTHNSWLLAKEICDLGAHLGQFLDLTIDVLTRYMLSRHVAMHLFTGAGIIGRCSDDCHHVPPSGLRWMS